MVEAAVSYLVQTLGDLLIHKVSFLGSVEGEVQGLKDELKRMQCFLKDAGEKQAGDERVRNWISEIREVALDSQDVIEIFLVKVENARRRRSLLRNTVGYPIHVYHVNNVGKEIQSIRKRLQKIESSLSTYGIKNLGEETSMTKSRPRFAHWQTDKHLVGMEKDVELLLRKVILDEKELRLSSATITGMGGIGKSTLAKVVYNHRGVVDRFERRCWVVVSSELRPKEILKELMLQLLKPKEDRLKILEEMEKMEVEGIQEMVKELKLQQLTPTEQMMKKMEVEGIQEMVKELKVLEMMEKMEVHNIKEMIHQQLKDRRYFIVVDDVWEDAHWEAIADAFPDQDNGSRLLLTSRNLVKTKHTRYVHSMELLNPEESWKLLLKKADIEKDDGKCPEEVENIVWQILDKCKGLLLAICVVGGILAKLQRQSKTEFEKVLKAINTHMGTSGKSNVSAILELSYQNLPSQLKPCFLCLAFFKEDADIEAKKLVYIWIALGLIQQEGEETMEEIAMRYLDELINRNMIQVKKMTKYDTVKNCGMHDLIRDLCMSKAKEEMRFETLRDGGEGSSQSLSKPRHCAFYITKKWWLHLDQKKHVRSVFIHGNVGASPSSYWKSFELLRILDLKGCPLYEFPKAICGLIELRYLRLRGTILWRLPRSIGKLKNLVVLDFGNEFYIWIPNVLWKMDSLRHVYAGLIICITPLKLNTLKNMQTFSLIWLKDSEIERVSQMTSLRKLGIDARKLSNGSKLFTSLAKMENLVSLKFKYCGSLNMEGLATLHRITQLKLDSYDMLPTNFPPNLSHLTLTFTSSWLSEEEVEEDPMPILEKLPKLLYLKLDRAYRGEQMVISEGSFPMLQVLHMSLMYLEDIEMGKGAMSKLRRLNLDGCSSLKSLPQELKAMKYLEELSINSNIGSESDVCSHLISNLPFLTLVNIPT